MPIIVFLWGMVAVPPSGGILDVPTLSRVLDGLYAPLEDLSCEFEGLIDFTTDDEGDVTGTGRAERYDTFTGLLIHRSDGALLLDIYHKYGNDEIITRQTIASIDGRYNEYARTEDRPDGGGVISNAHFKRPDIEGSAVRFFCMTLLKGHLEDPEVRMIHEGSEVIDGHLCEIFTFSLDRVPDMTAANASVEKFWVDLGRGGQVMRRETHRGRGKLAHRLSNVKLRQFDDGRGGMIWIPISGTYESFAEYDEEEKDFRYLKTPVAIETSYFLIESMRINQGISDSRFDVKFRNDTFVTDQLRRARYSFGQGPPRPSSPMSHTEAEEQLAALLHEAEAQGDELGASSWARGGWISMTVIPYAISALGMMVLFGLLWVMRRRS